MIMEQPRIRIYDVFDTLVTTNIFELIKNDDPELYRQAIADITPVRAKVLQLDEQYRQKGKIKTVQLPNVRAGLESTLKNGYILGVFSNGEPEGIKKMLSEGGIDGLFTEIISVSQFGDKNKPESYVKICEMLKKKDIVIASYADDKPNFCTAAVQSNVVSVVYHVNPKKSASPEKCISISGINEIDSIKQ